MTPKHIFIYALIVLPSFIYTIAMSIIFCDVEIKTDKDIYNTTDTAYVTLQQKGYVFLV